MCNELYSVSNCIDYARSAFMTRHVNIIHIIRLASKFLNCTHSLQNIAQKIRKYATKHEINTIKVSSDNFTNLPVTFLVENYIEITKKFAMFFNILLNFLL